MSRIIAFRFVVFECGWRNLIESATKHIDVSQLAISPQCGFASTMHGNELDEDAQWRKLEEMVKAAEKVWGGVPAGA